MSPSEQAAAHDANFIGTFGLIARLIEGGSLERVRGITVAVTGTPVPFFNAAWASATTTAEDLGQAVARLRAANVPYVVHVPAETVPAAKAALGLGLTFAGRLPCFALEPGPLPEAPPDLVIERVGRANLDAFLTATEAGFDMPRSLAAQLYPIAFTEDERVHAFVGSLSGVPVATSLAVRTGDTVGIYSVATVPEARGRGIGTAMTWHLLRDADPGWTLAVLQASDMGRPVYERMGFTLVREFDEYVGPPAI
jgi:ribosomal protein S18 acetylase RimI-like enzyme